MPTAIADTSPLIAFSAIRRLDVLRSVFTAITIPLAVARELEAGDWKEAQVVLREIRSETWISQECVESAAFALMPPANLGAGELEVIRLASSSGLTALIDDSDARKFATQIGVSTVGSLGILARAKSLGSIQAVRPLVEGMLGCGIYLGPALVSSFLANQKEL